jgi:hypothetical protein
MKCPHCGIDFHEFWSEQPMVDLNARKLFSYFRGVDQGFWYYRTTLCSKCRDVIIEIAPYTSDDDLYLSWRMVYPIGATRGPVPPEVPPQIGSDYLEACNVLTASAKASAALSRRCLQNILHQAGYKDRDLAREIDLLLNESDPRKAIPQRLRDTIDAIRNFGNFSAHPINDKTALQVIDVEPEEADWCLEILEECFEHFYVGPAVAKAKKAALDAKLAAAGKPPSKG